MPRKIPMRRCVATREQLPKKELLRIVRSENGVLIDPTGKVNGRGAYLKKDVAAVAIAKKTKALEKALEVSIPEEFYQEIITLIENE